MMYNQISNNTLEEIENYTVLQTIEDGDLFQVKFDLIFFKISRCQNKKNNSLSLIKCIPSSTLNKIGDIASTESAALKKVNSVNVIKITQYLLINYQHYLFLEYCDSSLNEKFCENNYQLSEEEAIIYMLGITEGVMAIHQQNIIHRDLQIGNILLLNNQPKICNFGYMRFLYDQDQSQVKFTVKLGISAPEIMNPSYKPSFKEDIFSLGSILYTLISGALPFDCSNQQNYIKSVQQGNLKFNSQLFSQANTISLIQKMLKFNPLERPTLVEIKNTLSQLHHFGYETHRNQNSLKPLWIETIDLTNIEKYVKQILYFQETADEFGGKSFYNYLKIIFPRLMLYKRCYLELTNLVKFAKPRNENNSLTSIIRKTEENIIKLKQKLEKQVQDCRNQFQTLETSGTYNKIQNWKDNVNLEESEDFYQQYQQSMEFCMNYFRNSEIPYVKSKNDLSNLQQMLIVFAHVQICSVAFGANDADDQFESVSCKTISQLLLIAKMN